MTGEEKSNDVKTGKKPGLFSRLFSKQDPVIAEVKGYMINKDHCYWNAYKAFESSAKKGDYESIAKDIKETFEDLNLKNKDAKIRKVTAEGMDAGLYMAAYNTMVALEHAGYVKGTSSTGYKAKVDALVTQQASMRKRKEQAKITAEKEAAKKAAKEAEKAAEMSAEPPEKKKGLNAD